MFISVCACVCVCVWCRIGAPVLLRQRKDLKVSKNILYLLVLRLFLDFLNLAYSRRRREKWVFRWDTFKDKNIPNLIVFFFFFVFVFNICLNSIFIDWYCK